MKSKNDFYFIEHLIYRDNHFTDMNEGNFFAESTSHKSIARYLKQKVKGKRGLRVYDDDPYLCFDYLDGIGRNHLYRIEKIDINDYLDENVYKIEIHKIDGNGNEANVYDLLNPDFTV